MRDVALTVGDLLGLDGGVVTDLAGQVTDHILGGFLNALLDGPGGDLSDSHVRCNRLSVVNKQQRAAGDVDLLSFAFAGGVDGELEVSLSLLGVNTMGGSVGADACFRAELHGALNLGADHTGFRRGHTTGVERSHGELRSWLADRLCSDDADGFAQIDQFVVSQSPAVALTADRAVGFAGQRGAHAHRFDACLLESLGQRWVDFGVALSEDFALGRHHLLSGETTHQTIAELAVLSLHDDQTAGAAVVLTHDHVLGDIHQTTGEISRVSGAQGRVHQTLAGAVGGDDVFRDRQTLAEVGADRKVDDLALRVCHQATHAHQLAHLGHVSPGTGVGHHPHRIEWIVLVEVLLDRIHQTLIGLGPGVDDLGVPLNLRDHTKAIRLLGGSDQLLCLSQQILLRLRDFQVIHRDRHRSLGGVFEAKILELVGHGGCGRRAVVFVSPGNQLFQAFLINHSVSERWGSLRQGAGLLRSGSRSLGCLGSLGGLGGLTGFGRGGGHDSAEKSWLGGGSVLSVQVAATASMIV